jgi:hypothetical protein
LFADGLECAIVACKVHELAIHWGTHGRLQHVNA